MTWLRFQPVNVDGGICEDEYLVEPSDMAPPVASSSPYVQRGLPGLLLKAAASEWTFAQALQVYWLHATMSNALEASGRCAVGAFHHNCV